jgi:hypothetical protein
MTEIRWRVPDEIDTSKYTRTRILRSPYEQACYETVDEIETRVGDELVQRYEDAEGNDRHFYVIRFFDPDKKVLYQDFLLGYHLPSVRERRLVETQILGWIPDVLRDTDLNEAEILSCLQMSLGFFNTYPPETNFSFNSFPKNYEPFLVHMARINILILKYPKLAIRDFAYSDMGLTLNVERGPKFVQSIQDLDKMYKDYLGLAKWNFTAAPIGLGSTPMPISFGGQISRGAMNMLDIMTALGK